MRATIFAVILVVLVNGCASGGSDRWKAEAARMGMAQEEVADIARLAAETHKLVVVRILKTADDAIEVYLGDRSDRPHGIVVVFRKIDGRWREDPKSQGEWIV